MLLLGQVYAFLCILSLAVQGILTGLVFYYLNTLSLIGLLQTVARNHIQLTDFVLQNNE